QRSKPTVLRLLQGLVDLRFLTERFAVISQVNRVGLAAGLTAFFLAGAIVPDNTETLFQRIKARMTEHLAQLPNYTCHETIDRMLRRGSDFRRVDTVELEVAFIGRQELFSRPGTDRFGEQPIEQIASGGTVGTDAMGSHIDMIFSLDLAEFKF